MFVVTSWIKKETWRGWVAQGRVKPELYVVCLPFFTGEKQPKEEGRGRPEGDIMEEHNCHSPGDMSIIHLLSWEEQGRSMPSRKASKAWNSGINHFPIIQEQFECFPSWASGAARSTWGHTVACSELSLHFPWGIDTSPLYAFPILLPWVA